MSKRLGFNEYKILNDEEAEFYIINRKKERFTVKVDLEVLYKLIELNRMWHAVWFDTCKTYYVRCCEHLKGDNDKLHNIFYLHRWLLDCDKDTIVDHINHDSLDNRKCNLRVTNIADNSKHRSGKNSNNKSGYRNVCWFNNKWNVQLCFDGKNVILGKFDDVDEAGKFAEEMRRKYYGEYAGVS